MKRTVKLKNQKNSKIWKNDKNRSIERSINRCVRKSNYWQIELNRIPKIRKFDKWKVQKLRNAENDKTLKLQILIFWFFFSLRQLILESTNTPVRYPVTIVRRIARPAKLYKPTSKKLTLLSNPKPKKTRKKTAMLNLFRLNPRKKNTKRIFILVGRVIENLKIWKVYKIIHNMNISNVIIVSNSFLR